MHGWTRWWRLWQTVALLRHGLLKSQVDGALHSILGHKQSFKLFIRPWIWSGTVAVQWELVSTHNHTHGNRIGPVVVENETPTTVSSVLLEPIQTIGTKELLPLTTQQFACPALTDDSVKQRYLTASPTCTFSSKEDQITDQKRRIFFHVKGPLTI